MSRSQPFLFSIIALILISFSFGCRSSKPESESDPFTVQFKNAMKLYSEKDYYGAQMEFTKLTYTSRATEFEDDVQYYLAACYFNNEQYLLAVDGYQSLLRNTPTSPFSRIAYFQIAQSYFMMSPIHSLDQTYTETAIRQYQQYIDTYPVPDSATIASETKNLNELMASADDSTKKAQYLDVITRYEDQYGQLDTLKLCEARIAVCREKLAHKIFDVATQYTQLQAYRAATLYFDEIVSSYPDSPYFEKALIGKIETLITREHWEEAKDELARYEEKFPEKKKSVSRLQKKVDEHLTAGATSNLN